jgi:ankyrin repeat protein
VDIIKFLFDKGMSVNLKDTDNLPPLHVSAGCGNLEATKAFVRRYVVLKNAKKNSHGIEGGCTKVTKCKSFITSQILPLS